MSGSFDAGSVIARIKADLTEFQAGLKKAKKEMQSFGEKTKESWGDLNDAVKKYEKGIKAVTVASAAVAAAGALAMRDWIKSSEDQVRVNKQLEAVLKSTGGTVGLTAQQIQDMAAKFQKLTTIGDEAIQQGQNMLLTFTNIRKDAFEPATAILLDMSTAMNGGVTPSAEQLSQQAIQLGKALNDPIQGISALSRVGVSFTEQQKAMIEKLQKAGDILGAQKIILAELGKEFGGSASAQLETFTGKLKNLYNRIGDIKERLGTALIPIVDSFAKILEHVVEILEGLSPETIRTIAVVTVLTTAVAALATGIGAFLLLVPKITAGFAVIKAGMLAINPVLVVLTLAFGAFVAYVAKKQGEIKGAWDTTTSAIQADVQKQSDTWNAWNMAAAKLAANEQEYARLRAKAQYYILQSTLLTESQIAAIRAGASQEQLNAIQANIDGNNKWARDAAQSAIDYANTHTVNMKVVNKALSQNTSALGENTGAISANAEAAKEAAEAAAKDHQEQIKNRAKMLKDLVDFKKGADDALTELREGHEETLKSMGKDIENLKEKLSDLKIAYDKDIDDIRGGLKKNLAKMQEELNSTVLTIQVRAEQQRGETQRIGDRQVAEKYVAQQDELARIKDAIGKATTFAEKQRLEQEYSEKKAILDTDAQYVIGLEATIAEVKRYNSLTEIQRIVEDTALKIASINSAAAAEILAAQNSYASKVAIAKQEAKDAEAKRTAEFTANKLQIQKELGEKTKALDDEIFLFNEKEKAIISIRNRAVQIYAEQIAEMVRFTDRSVNAMIERYQALNKAIQGVGKSKDLTKLVGWSTVDFGNVGRTQNLVDIQQLLSELKLPSSIPKMAMGGIVKRPTLAQIGEGGEPEAVIPLSKMGTMGAGGGVHIHVDGAIIGSVDAAVDLLDMAIRRVRPSLGV